MAKNSWKEMTKLVFIALFVIVLTACGSGGGGDDNGGSSSISYSGLTSQATITASNAEDIATGAYVGGQRGSALSSAGAIAAHEDNRITTPLTLAVSQALENALRKADIPSHSGGIASGAFHEERIPGDCGSEDDGYADIAITYDEMTGAFNGSMNFHGFCSDDVFISGNTGFSGKLDPDSLARINFTFSFDNLTCYSGSDSFTIKGDLSVDASTPPVTTTMGMLLKDNNSGKVYKLENYVITITEGEGYIVIAVSGKYYDPAYGYVEISTPIQLMILAGYNWPFYGQMVLTGNTGIDGGRTKVRLTAISSIHYRVEADTDGDGTYDNYDSGQLMWSDL